MENILIRPLITEKGSLLTERQNKYGFIVNRNANKIQIREAVEKMFNVTVTNVNTMVVPGKAKQRYTKAGFISGQTPAYKKAVVSLAEGDSIDFYSNV